MVRVLLTGLILFFYAGLIPAQKFQILNENYPIPRTDAITQDCHGFLWLGTTDGLIRYDGYAIKKYTNDPTNPTSLPGNNVNAILADSHGNLWVGLSGDGLVVFNRSTEAFRQVCLSDSGDTCLTSISIGDLSYDSGGHVWVGTEMGLFILRVTPDTSVVQHHAYAQVPGSLSHNTVYELVYDPKGRMWIGTANGINLYVEGDTFINYRNDSSFLTGQIVDIAVQPTNGRVWVCPRQMPYPLYYWDEEREMLVPYTLFPPSDNREFRIAFDFQDRMWISARSYGMYRHHLQSGATEFFDPNTGNHHGFKTYASTHPFTDTYGNIWIGGAPLTKWPFSRKPFQSILSDGFTVAAVFADSRYVWFSARKPLRWNRETQKVEEYWPSDVPKNLLLSVNRNPGKVVIYKYMDLGEDLMLFTTTRSIFLWNRANDTYREIPTMYGGPFRDFEFGMNNNFWICGNQGTPIEFKLANMITSDLGKQGLRAIMHPYCVVRDSTGFLWFGSARNGLYRFNELTREVKHFLPEDSGKAGTLSSNHVHDILVHSDHTLWIGTNLGLNHFDPQTEEFVHYNQQHGLRNQNVTSILEDDHGNLWMGTHDGLARFDIHTHDFTHFSRSEGLCNIVFSDRAAYKDDDGWMYFAGNSGVDFFHPDSIGYNPIPPDVYVKSVRLHNFPVAFEHAPENAQELTFKHNENFIEIELLALHFTAPEANRYAYRLAEDRSHGSQWRDLGTNRVVTLANISPGNYTLLARAANADGLWSAEKRLLHLRIKPPFWQTAWFYGIAALFLAAIVAAIYYYRVRQIRHQEALKTTFNKKIAEIELKALQAQMNPHFLFNSLNSVKSLIGKKENKKASLYLTRFSQLIRQVLNNSRKKFVKLSDELEALRLYLDLESMRFKEQFSFSIRVDDNVNVDFVEVPPLLLQPYVENAIWHGLLPKGDGERLLSIEVQRNGEFIHMIVEDNGIGREQAWMLQKHRGKESLGMKITGDRLKFLQQLYGREARVKVDDLQSPTGTRVTIYLPIPD